jgi:hypothetical protein
MTFKLDAKTSAEVKAGSQLKLSGAMAELSGSATTDVKGGMVNIN